MTSTNMTCEQLRDALKKSGKAIYGNKDDLYNRLVNGPKKGSSGIGKKRAVPKKPTAGKGGAQTSTVKMKSKLPDAMAKALNLTYLKTDNSSGTTEYVYAKSKSSDASSKSSCKGNVCAKKKKVTTKPEVCDTVSDEALEEAMSVVAWRLENHVPHDLMKKLGECFNVESVPRAKKDAAEVVAEQLCYETDSDDEDDEEGSDDESSDEE